jgi:hypothetical protein
MTIKKPQVLIIYYTHTQQARRVADKTADVLRDRGCETGHSRGNGCLLLH